MDRKTALENYIRDEIMHNRNANLDENEDLIIAGILDSLGILQLVAFIEENFGIQVPGEDIVYENFKSVSAITNYLS